jgi:hypothetical protein
VTRAVIRRRIDCVSLATSPQRRIVVSEITRLGFVKSSAKTVAGATALAVLVTSQSEADTTHVGTEPVVAYVKNPRNGEIAVMSGEREVTVRDRELAAKIAKAAG